MTFSWYCLSHRDFLCRIKKCYKNPKSVDKLRQISIEEWNKIPKDFIQKLFSNFIKDVKKFLRQIRQDTNEEQNNDEEQIINQD